MKKDWLRILGWAVEAPDHNPENVPEGNAKKVDEALSEAAEEICQKEFFAQLPVDKKHGGKFDPMSPTWAFIEAWAEEKLDKLRKKNDIVLNTEKMSSNDRTFRLRGQIKAMKDVINIPEEVKKEQDKLRNR